MTKNILLTGSGGFVGGNLKEFFKGKYNLYTPRSFELDLCNSVAVKKYFSKNDIDFVIHCGSIGGYRNVQDKDTTIEDNLAMVENILAFKTNSTRVILFGSGAMYNKQRNLHKVNEEEIGKYIPSELYGKSKLLIAQKIKDRNDVLCLNIFGCYGKNEKSTRFPTYAITQNLRHQNIEINQNVIFDYLYIDDLCEIVDYFIKNKSGNNILNITPTESISLLEIAQIINDISDFHSKIIIKNPIMNFEYTGDNTKLLNEIGDYKFTPYKKGLKNLYNLQKEKIK